MNAISNFFDLLLGLGVQPKDLTFVQISLRGIIVFLATLLMVRLGHKRSLARKTAFDAVLIVNLAPVFCIGRSPRRSPSSPRDESVRLADTAKAGWVPAAP